MSQVAQTNPTEALRNDITPAAHLECGRVTKSAAHGSLLVFKQSADMFRIRKLEHPCEGLPS